MAGDWIKMEMSTPEKAEVLAITAKMGWDDPDLTVGKLFRLWRWFDQQTLNGNAAGVTSALLDKVIGVTGFCDAVQSVGWMISDDDGLTLPNFDVHNGITAKTRALTAKRVAKHKTNATSNATGNAHANAPSVRSSVSLALPREEKRREERIPPIAPQGAGVRFDEFWQAYPRKVGKGKAETLWKRLKLNSRLPEVLTAIAAQCRTEQWQKDGGQFIPHPATWLAQKRWEDEAQVGAAVAIDPESRTSIEARGVRVGIGKWDEVSEQWGQYKARVLGAVGGA